MSLESRSSAAQVLEYVMENIQTALAGNKVNDLILSGDKEDSNHNDMVVKLANRVNELSEALSKSEGAQKVEVENQVADATLGTMIETHQGNEVEDHKIRLDIQDLRLQLLQGGSDLKASEAVEKAKVLLADRFKKFQEDGGTPASAMDVPRPNSKNGDRDFSLCKLLGGAVEFASQKKIKTLDYTNLGGSEEAEILKDRMKDNPIISENLGRVVALSKEGASIIPVPISNLNLGMHTHRLAQTYDSTGGTYGNREYRQDLLVPFYRPPGCMDQLGVSQMVIDRDVSIPRVASEQNPTWGAETADAVDQSLTLSVQNSTSRRLSHKTDINWQALVSRDQIGIELLVMRGLSKGMAQAREKAAYGKGGTGMPTGLGGSTTNDPNIGSAPDSLVDVLAYEQALQDDNIELGMGRWLISPSTRTTLASNLTFTSSSATVSIPLFRDSMGMPGAAYEGFILGRGACVSNNVPTNLGGSSDETMCAFGVWENLHVFDYSIGFLTVDDISQALNARTRVTMNSFHDVIMKFGDAFAVDSYTE